MANNSKNYPSRRKLRQAQRDAQRARADAPTTRTTQPVHPNTGTHASAAHAPAQAKAGARASSQRKKSAPSLRPKGRKKAKRPPLSPKQRRRRLIKRIATGTLALFLLGILGACGLFLSAYFLMDIPSPDQTAKAEITTVYYADGKTKMAEFAKQNRTIIDTTQLPDYVAHAVVASEDRTFFENSGVDIRGIARALWNNVRGRPTQGGSTLSQQYAENYYLGTNKTYWGKFKETILALKINRQQDKKEILNNYLNTIYFGRSAYGIEAAAQAYFGKPAAELTVSESALLAGIIPAPSAYDPQISPEIAHMRWERVLNNMVSDGWLSKADRDKQEFPETIPNTPKSSDYTGSKGYLLTHVRHELVHEVGYKEEELDTLGLKITTTIDPDKQKIAEEAVARLPEHQANLRVGLVSIDSATGGIVAEYGGADYEKIQRSAAFQDQAMAGSTFKPFALVAALEQGMTPNTRISGASPMVVNGEKVGNVDHSYGNITLAEAAKYSVNTSFVRLNDKVGVDATRQVAIDAGYPADTPGLDATSVVSVLGTASPHTVNIADAFTTFATGGVRRPAHIVASVSDSSGKELYKADTSGTRVFDADVIAQLNEVLQGVVHGGTAEKAEALGRPVAAKTGSSEDLRSAQFVGYIPQMVTAVSMYQVGEDGSEESITGFGGVKDVYGGTWPAQVWNWYMLRASADLEVKSFPDAASTGAKSAPKYKKPDYSVPEIPTPTPDVTLPTVSPHLPQTQPDDGDDDTSPSPSPSPSTSESSTRPGDNSGGNAPPGRGQNGRNP
ncbi:transglycosylase domain-containing protein [Nanchangia anserum]